MNTTDVNHKYQDLVSIWSNADNNGLKRPGAGSNSTETLSTDKGSALNTNDRENNRSEIINQELVDTCRDAGSKNASKTMAKTIKTIISSLFSSLSVGLGLGFGLPSFTFAGTAGTVLFKVGALTMTAGLASTFGVALLAGLVVGAAVYAGVSYHNQSDLSGSNDTSYIVSKERFQETDTKINKDTKSTNHDQPEAVASKSLEAGLNTAAEACLSTAVDLVLHCFF